MVVLASGPRSALLEQRLAASHSDLLVERVVAPEADGAQDRHRRTLVQADDADEARAREGRE
jgi:hypothetical protein